MSRHSFQLVSGNSKSSESDDAEPFRNQAHLSHEKRWHRRPIFKMFGAVLLAVALIAIGLLFLSHQRFRHIIHKPQNGLFGDLETMQGSKVFASNRVNQTVYGAPLETWQRDTSREYHLSRNGLWDVNQKPQTREFTFHLNHVMAAPDGVSKKMLVVNGGFPGPVIEANEGDKLVVHVHNHGDSPTSIHFHGLHFKGENYMDGASGITQCPIKPGGSFTYEFNLTQYGTYWYHSHYSTQYLEGVAGPVVIHSKKEQETYKYDEDVVVMLSDLYHDNSFDLIKSYIAPGVENSEPVPNSGLIQGANVYDCDNIEDNSKYQCSNSSRRSVIPVVNDKVYRLRLISAGGFSEFDFSIDNHRMSIIETDGTNTEPYDINVLRLSNAQRYSVLVKMDQKQGSFWMRAVMNKYCYDGDSDDLDSDVKAVLSYPDCTQQILSHGGDISTDLVPKSSKHEDLGGSVSCIELDAKLLTPKFPQTVPDAEEFMQVDASFQIGARTITLGYFNDSSYRSFSSAKENTLQKVLDGKVGPETFQEIRPDWAEKQMIVTIPQKKVVDLVINNYDDGAHPFHMHGYRFWVLDGGKGYFNYEHYEKTKHVTKPTIQRDTVQVDKFGWALIRIEMDNPGIWTFHCHILWHTVAGMLMQFLVMPEQLALQEPPESWSNLCKA